MLFEILTYKARLLMTQHFKLCLKLWRQDLHPERRFSVLVLWRSRTRRLLPRAGKRGARRNPPGPEGLEMRQEGQGHRKGRRGGNGRVALACKTT